MKVWTTRECRTWLVRDKDSLPELLRLVGVQSLSIELDNNHTRWTCGYCGSYVLNETYCTHCNAPKTSRLREAEAIVHGYLPFGLVLDNLEDGFTLEVQWGQCCDPSDYDAGIPILRLTDCHIVSKYIPEIDPIGDQENAVLEMIVSVDCNVFFYRGKDEND